MWTFQTLLWNNDFREGKKSKSIFQLKKPNRTKLLLANSKFSILILGTPFNNQILVWLHTCLAQFPTPQNLSEHPNNSSSGLISSFPPDYYPMEEEEPDSPDCPVIFDSWKCWPAATRGQLVRQNCPNFPDIGFKETSEYRTEG